MRKCPQSCHIWANERVPYSSASWRCCRCCKCGRYEVCAAGLAIIVWLFILLPRLHVLIYSAVHLAALQGHVTLLREALLRSSTRNHSRVADAVTAVDKLGNTPLHYGAMQQNISVVKALLTAGAQACKTIANGAKATPADLAVESELKSLLQ